jgi:hypothetical protein
MVSSRRKLTDRGLAAGSTVLCGHFQETVGINLKGRDELGLATRHRGDAIELKFTEQAIITALRSLTLVSETDELQIGERRKLLTPGR